jgi:hypothetical protein
MIRPLTSKRGIPKFKPDEKSFLSDKTDTPPIEKVGKPKRLSEQWGHISQAWKNPRTGSTAPTDAVTMRKDLELKNMG